MNVLLNFGTLKSGGGQTVALNFLKALNASSSQKHNYVVIVASESEIDKFLSDYFPNKFPIVRFPQHPIKRIFKELIYGKRIISTHGIDIIYSYFGYSYFPREIPQVIGSADSNLYFPEIRFWAHYKGLPLLKRKLVDEHRKWGLKRADGVILENRAMMQRYRKLFSRSNMVSLILPSLAISPVSKNLKKKEIKNEKVGLFLCGWQMNKNFMLIPEIAAELKANGVSFKFIFTAPLDHSAIHRSFIKKLEEYNVEKMVSMVGPVSNSELESLYNEVDFVFLLSKLESFSNNIIESWHYNKVLLVSDEPWARAICTNSAIYVNRDSPLDIATKICELMGSKHIEEEIKQLARVEYSKYPNIDDRFRSEIQFLEKVHSYV
jgi:glycosyltransferase involved in cell wall biosynthesis